MAFLSLLYSNYSRRIPIFFQCSAVVKLENIWLQPHDTLFHLHLRGRARGFGFGCGFGGSSGSAEGLGLSFATC